MLPQNSPSQPTDNTARALATRVEGYGVAEESLDLYKAECPHAVSYGADGEDLERSSEFFGADWSVVRREVTRFLEGVEKRAGGRKEAEEISRGIKRFTSLKSVQDCGKGRGTRKMLLDPKKELWDKPGQDSFSVDVLETNGVAHFRGVYRCKSRWACWDCGRRHVEESVRKYTRVMELFRKDHPEGTEGFLTLTVRNSRFDDLKVMREGVTVTYRGVFKGRCKKILEEKYGFLGHFRALDVTHGEENGFHPHIHAVLLFSRKLSGKELKEVYDLIYKYWKRLLLKVGMSTTEDCNRLEFARNVQDLASYIARSSGVGGWGSLSREVVGPVVKTAKRGHRSISQIYRDAARDGKARDIEICHELERGLVRAQMLTCSKYVRELLSRVEEEAKAKEEEENVSVRVCLELPRWFYRVCLEKGWKWRVLRICEYNGDGEERIREGLGEEWEKARLCHAQSTKHWERRYAPKSPVAIVGRLLEDAERLDRKTAKRVRDALERSAENEETIALIGANEMVLEAPS